MTTKVHVAVDALGNPVRFILTPGQASDIKQAPALIEGIETEAVVADRGYDSAAFVEMIEQQGAEAVIPSRKTNKHQRCYDGNLYCDRNKIERFIGRLKQHRRVATRYDKCPASFLGFVLTAAVLALLK